MLHSIYYFANSKIGKIFDTFIENNELLIIDFIVTVGILIAIWVKFFVKESVK